MDKGQQTIAPPKKINSFFGAQKKFKFCLPVFSSTFLFAIFSYFVPDFIFAFGIFFTWKFVFPQVFFTPVFCRIIISFMQNIVSTSYYKRLQKKQFTAHYFSTMYWGCSFQEYRLIQVNWRYQRLLQVTTGYFMFLQFTRGYLRLLKSTTGYYRIHQDTTGYYRVLEVITGYQRLLQSSADYYRLLNATTVTA